VKIVNIDPDNRALGLPGCNRPTRFSMPIPVHRWCC
jgi:hypothetical protein